MIRRLLLASSLATVASVMLFSLLVARNADAAGSISVDPPWFLFVEIMIVLGVFVFALIAASGAAVLKWRSISPTFSWGRVIAVAVIEGAAVVGVTWRFVTVDQAWQLSDYMMIVIGSICGGVAAVVFAYVVRRKSDVGRTTNA